MDYVVQNLIWHYSAICDLQFKVKDGELLYLLLFFVQIEIYKLLLLTIYIYMFFVRGHTVQDFCELSPLAMNKIWSGINFPLKRLSNP